MELQYTFDSNKFHLGSLCQQNHKWPGTELSLRRTPTKDGDRGTNCIGCQGNRKDKNWLASFIDSKAMGLPDEQKLGWLCKRVHKWENMEVTLRINGECKQCAKHRETSLERKLYRKKNKSARAIYSKNHYEKNKESILQKLKIKHATLEFKEQRRQNIAVKRATIGRASRAKGLSKLILPPGVALKQQEARVFLLYINQGYPCVYEILQPLVEQYLITESELNNALKNIGHTSSVQQLVANAQRQYWIENPNIKRKLDKDNNLFRYHFRYMTDPDFRLYHRQKSKRRKAVMRNSHALNVKVKHIRERFNEFNNLCAYCSGTGDLHIEHVIPISKGGPHCIGNIIPACQRCNYSKATHDVESWYKSQPFYSQQRWNKIQHILGWHKSGVNQLALL